MYTDAANNVKNLSVAINAFGLFSMPDPVCVKNSKQSKLKGERAFKYSVEVIMTDLEDNLHVLLCIN